MSNDRSQPDATERGTDPGAVSEVAAATSDEAADTAIDAARTGYTKDSDGDDEHQDDAPGAGRSSVSDIGKDG